MAYIKQTITLAGVTAEYWSVNKITYDRQRKIATVEFGCWLSEKAKKTDGFAQIETRYSTLEGEYYPSEKALDQIEEIYLKVKANTSDDFFAQAVSA